MSKNIIDDGYSSYLVDGATFVGKYQIPSIPKHDVIRIPKDMVPFDKRNVVKERNLAIDFYMHDVTFRQILTSTSKYLDELSRFAAVISPDCSLYRDMPLCLQITNTYMSRAVGFYLQRRGVYVIPNVRWGDERSFEFCFQGLPTNDIVCVSTHGCIKGEENKYYFKLGLEEMLNVLKPQVVLVHGPMPVEVFSDFPSKTKLVHYKSYISKMKGGRRNG